MEIPEGLRYTSEHEWVRMEDGVGVVGITEFAQDQLGDVVYVDLPQTGTRIIFLEKFGEIESVKAVSDLYSPVSGEVVASNEQLVENPELVNESPYALGWLVRVRLTDLAELEKLLSAQEYRQLVEQATEE